MKNVDVVLVEPENPGNIGAVARVMKNFGFTNLILVNPCPLDDARAQAKHAHDVVKNAKIIKIFEPWRYEYVIGTTGIVGADRPCIAPEAVKVPKARTAVVFGNEGRGLSKRERDACDVLVHVNTTKDYAVMNLSHAVAIILYELSKRPGGPDIASRAVRQNLEKAFINMLDNLDYPNKERAALAFHNTINKIPPTHQEASVLLGVFKRVVRGLG